MKKAFIVASLGAAACLLAAGAASAQQHPAGSEYSGTVPWQFRPDNERAIRLQGAAAVVANRNGQLTGFAGGGGGWGGSGGSATAISNYISNSVSCSASGVGASVTCTGGTVTGNTQTTTGTTIGAETTVTGNTTNNTGNTSNSGGRDVVTGNNNGGN